VRPLGYDRDGRPLHDVFEWTRLHDDLAYVHVRATAIGEIEVSTVWLGIDHNWTGHGPPIIFESMVFGGPLDGCAWRYATLAEAEAGHDEVVAQVRAEVRTP
jgi:hypothetical protein